MVRTMVLLESALPALGVAIVLSISVPQTVTLVIVGVLVFGFCAAVLRLYAIDSMQKAYNEALRAVKFPASQDKGG